MKKTLATILVGGALVVGGVVLYDMQNMPTKQTKIALGGVILTEVPRNIRTEQGKRWGDLYINNLTGERFFEDSKNPNYYLISERDKGHPEKDGYTWIGSGDMPIYKDETPSLKENEFFVLVENSPTTTRQIRAKISGQEMILSDAELESAVIIELQ